MQFCRINKIGLVGSTKLLLSESKFCWNNKKLLMAEWLPNVFLSQSNSYLSAGCFKVKNGVLLMQLNKKYKRLNMKEFT